MSALADKFLIKELLYSVIAQTTVPLYVKVQHKQLCFPFPEVKVYGLKETD